MVLNGTRPLVIICAACAFVLAGMLRYNEYRDWQAHRETEVQAAKARFGGLLPDLPAGLTELPAGPGEPNTWKTSIGSVPAHAASFNREVPLPWYFYAGLFGSIAAVGLIAFLRSRTPHGFEDEQPMLPPQRYKRLP